MRELREVTPQVPAVCLLSVDPENAESKGKARFGGISSPGSRQLNAGSSNIAVSGCRGRDADRSAPPALSHYGAMTLYIQRGAGIAEEVLFRGFRAPEPST